MHVERDFKISIPDEEAEPVKTVKEVIDIIEQKVK
jgi:acyl carrier protein